MTGNEPQKIVDSILERYSQRTSSSRENDQKAKKHLPGGDSRAATYYTPYPVYMDNGNGCMIQDCDGNRYLDFHGNYTSLIHGHAHQPTLRAMQQQMEKGTVLGAPGVVMYEHADLLCSRVRGLDTVRYCNSGTEATLFAMRAARAFTGKDGILKMEGGYHGTHDFAEVSITPDLQAKGAPSPRIESRGVPANILDNMFVAPFNDLNVLEGILKDHHSQIAAIIMEPMLGALGQVPPLPGYLKGVREIADHYGVLLILDEVATFRLSLGGIQMIEGVIPDLTTFGKIIGGGLPVGAFGGRKEIMAIFDPQNPNGISHSGTYNGNNITLAAGIATLESFDQAAVDHVNRLGDRLREGFNNAFKEMGIRGQATGIGSLVDVHWTDANLVNARVSAAAFKAAQKLPMLLHLEMMNRGIFSPRRGQYCTCTPMTEEYIDRAIEELVSTLDLIKPYLAEKAPFLLA
jgi:glutamate-1-semialdehyde 2,1-aminomutase